MICVSINNLPLEKCLSEIKKFELAEIRVDLSDYSLNDIGKIFESHSNLIATFRESQGDERARFEFLTFAITSGAKYIDLDINSDLTLIDKLLPIIKANNCKLILSYHNYKETPTQALLGSTIKECLTKGADIVKVATYIRNSNDLHTVLALYKNHSNIVAIGMGELGRITRVVSTFLGAPFTFASRKDLEATALGQINYQSLDNIMSLING